MENILDRMETAVEESNEDGLYDEFIDLVTVFISTVMHHVDKDSALEEFRVRTGTEESHDLDELFMELIAGYADQDRYKEILNELDEDWLNLRQFTKEIIGKELLEDSDKEEE